MKYTVFCETENKIIEIENLLLREVCTTHPDHTVTSGSLTITEAGFEDCSGKDYRKLRHELMEYVTQNHQTMTTDELKQAAYHFCVPLEVINMFYTPLEQIANGKQFHQQATKCRKDRFDGVVTVLFNHLTYEETGQIISTLDTYIWKYIDLGVEGVTEGDVLGVFDYFMSSVGTIFENNGFIETGFIPRNNITITQLRDFLMDIFQNGCNPASLNYPGSS